MLSRVQAHPLSLTNGIAEWVWWHAKRIPIMRNTSTHLSLQTGQGNKEMCIPYQDHQYLRPVKALMLPYIRNNTDHGSIDLYQSLPVKVYRHVWYWQCLGPLLLSLVSWAMSILILNVDPESSLPLCQTLYLCMYALHTWYQWASRHSFPASFHRWCRLYLLHCLGLLQIGRLLNGAEEICFCSLHAHWSRFLEFYLPVPAYFTLRTTISSLFFFSAW